MRKPSRSVLPHAIRNPACRHPANEGGKALSSVNHIFASWAFLVNESLLWFSLVAAMFSSPQVIKWLRGHLQWFDRAVGALLIGLAVKVAAS
ncbi:LysE family transporter [Allopusillimonas ginsengisoli]|uniref:LysE family transporter n=1 Tax=Allopusillimonas ginsengisoli TaxID=453575 RepID=UPI0014301C62